MEKEILTALVSALGGLLGGMLGAGMSIWTERQKSRIERAKFLASLTSVSEIEKARIQAYTELWTCLNGISTFRPDEIVDNLPKVQERLQDWYYRRGGGLTIAGSASNMESTKAAFFVARDLVSKNPSEIWEAFHNLRRHLRKDLKIFQDDKEEEMMIIQTKAKLKKYEH
jgi:hypothetical protein